MRSRFSEAGPIVFDVIIVNIVIAIGIEGVLVHAVAVPQDADQALHHGHDVLARELDLVVLGELVLQGILEGLLEFSFFLDLTEDVVGVVVGVFGRLF